MSEQLAVLERERPSAWLPRGSTEATAPAAFSNPDEPGRPRRRAPPVISGRSSEEGRFGRTRAPRDHGIGAGAL